MKHDDFDVIVIGGGHAGCEAGFAAARMGAKTCLVTLKRRDLGTMSCNPAIGGLGKGHLVREIDAMDGVMGRVADYAGIQFRLLNRRKGPAVQGPRAQADRQRYRAEMARQIDQQSNLTVIEGEVVDLLMSAARVNGVALRDGSEIRARATILTSGTFLRGVIHIGQEQSSGGRLGDKASLILAERLASFDLPLGRLKTGTPPRLDGRTIDFSRLEAQPGDEDPTFFSFLTKATKAAQISCAITHTNEKTHEIIRSMLHMSAMYGGQIDGVGPRYCPSIEDKIVRFADKTSHQIFLEPEGLNTHTVYPNGISTSLPPDVQEDYVHSIVGLEHAKIEQPGYAIEYDYVDPRSLRSTLSLRAIDGLYLAGQINGTTGYEEAAAQGLVAGLNAAAQAFDREPVTFSRATSYIGVMIDDLTTNGVLEPYRMFTSRAEYRLSLRADNADQRLTPTAMDLNCVSPLRRCAFSEKKDALDAGQACLREAEFTPVQARGAGISLAQDGGRRSALQLLSLKDVSLAQIGSLVPAFAQLPKSIQRQLQIEALYSNYLDRQAEDAESLKRDESVRIPEDFDPDALSSLSNELKLKLSKSRPETIAQASRIDGMTPAALTLILADIRSREKKLRA